MTINLRQSRLDIERLHSAANRIDALETAYRLALDDLRIARTGLLWIAERAANNSGYERIRARAMDTLSLMLTDKD